VLLRALALGAGAGVAIEVFGDRGVLDRTGEALSIPLPAAPEIAITEVTRLSPGESIPGQPCESSDRSQVAYLEEAVSAARVGRLDALLTLPLQKAGAARAGFAFSGHTEFLAHALNAPHVVMLLAGPRLRVALATTHVALAAVPGALSLPALRETIAVTAIGLTEELGIAQPRLAVCGLNPHAGEGGMLGDEERRIIAPAIGEAAAELSRRSVVAELSGPHVPDVVFRLAAAGQFDAVVCMYHDQGLIPLKLLHGGEAVNVTLGLPLPRTSPDHGVAYDIAGTGTARPGSTVAALELAIAMAQRHGTSR
jgi:4-hydroxythreonine-4-phosphate dehydrogenase